MHALARRHCLSRIAYTPISVVAQKPPEALTLGPERADSSCALDNNADVLRIKVGDL